MSVTAHRVDGRLGVIIDTGGFRSLGVILVTLGGLLLFVLDSRNVERMRDTAIWNRVQTLAVSCMS